MWKRTFFNKAKSPPSREKHAVMERAFEELLRVCGGRGLVVLDAYAGCGMHASGGESGAGCSGGAVLEGLPEGALGSPLLLLRMVSLGLAEGCSCRVVLVEKNPHNHGELRRNLAELLVQEAEEAGGNGCCFRLPSNPDSVSVALLQGSFVDHLPGLLDEEDKRQRVWFSLLDPFAFEGLSMATMQALALRGTLVVHLACHAAAAALRAPSVAPSVGRRLTALFGTEESWRQLRARMTDEGIGGCDANQLVAATLTELLAAGCGHGRLRLELVALRRGKAFMLVASTHSK